MELQSEHNFGMTVTAKTRGRTGLKVVLRVSQPGAGQLEGNLVEFRDEIQIQVQYPPPITEQTLIQLSSKVAELCNISRSEWSPKYLGFKPECDDD